MTMAEMVCCAEHHDDCEMAGQAESCCASDLQSDMGVLATERTDTIYLEDVASHNLILPTPQLPSVSVLHATLAREDLSLLVVRSGPSTLSTVLRI